MDPAAFQKAWRERAKREFLREHGARRPYSVASFLKDFGCAPPGWRMYRIDDGWEAASKAKAAIRALRDRIKALDPKKWVKDSNLKARRKAAWEYGRYLTYGEVEKLLNCPPRPRKRKVAEAVG